MKPIRPNEASGPPARGKSVGSGRRWSVTSAAAAALALLLLAGCGIASSGDNPFEGGAGSSNSIRVDVENLNFNDATLYALSSGSRRRMGTIGGKSRGSYDVPWESQRELRIRIDLLAGSEYTTRSVSVGPGERLQLLIHSNLRQSTIRR